MKLTKDDFSCWGNGDKYDDELFISHDPKIKAVEIADEILKNQEDAEKFQKLMKWLNYSYDFTHDLGMPKELQKILEGEK